MHHMQHRDSEELTRVWNEIKRVRDAEAMERLPGRLVTGAIVLGTVAGIGYLLGRQHQKPDKSWSEHVSQDATGKNVAPPSR